MRSRLALLVVVALVACREPSGAPDGGSGGAGGGAATGGGTASGGGMATGGGGGVDAGEPDAGNQEPFPTAGGATAIVTFESIGLYWSPAGGAAGRACSVQYRVAGDVPWKQGLDLWFDARNGEYRGSLVLLRPGTSYQVKLSLTGATTEATLTARTWSEAFPIGATVALPTTSSATLQLGPAQSGTAAGYRLYTFAPGGSATLDAADAADFNIQISGAFIIIRGLTLRGAARDAIRLETGAHDIVIEDNDISGWGRVRDVTNDWGVNGDSAVHVAWRADGVDRIVVQRNTIHAPRHTSNSWLDGHPAGPVGIYFENCSLPDNFTCGSNHVIRHNSVVGDAAHYFMDGIGGEDNFSATGAYNTDSDISGNLVRFTWDDGIESEGANRNVRIWGNYLDETFTGIATATTNAGPVYLFRNVYDVSRIMPGNNDTIEHGPFGKLGDGSGFGGGRRYYFHNTLLQQPPPSGSQYGQGAGSGPLGGFSERPMVELVSRNNIWHLYRPTESALYGNASSANNDVDNDLHSGTIDVGGTGNVIGVRNLRGTPTYAAGHGAVSRSGGQYALAAGTPGFDGAERLPNFNDDFQGAGPDIGAAEAGAPAMKFGPAAGNPAMPPPPLTLPLAINAGGAAAAPFVADTGFSGGTPVTNWTGAIDVAGITDAAPAAVYQAERYGDFSYTIAGLTPSSSHPVRLHFCENYLTAAGLRLFDVSLNGTLVLDDYDVFAAAGSQHRAHVRTFTVVADGAGQIVVRLTSVTNSALLNGVEIL